MRIQPAMRDSEMRITALTSWAALAGGGAVLTAVSVCLLHPTAAPPPAQASGSGDSATGTNFTQPTVPGMSMGSTASAAPTPTIVTAASTLATSVASPTLKATPPSGF